jgi:hypothetical protein
MHDDIQQYGVGEGVVLPPQRQCQLPPYTGKLPMAKTEAWHHGVSPSSRQQRLESLTDALRSLADARLGAAPVLANLHHLWIVPLMERELHIFEMNDEADPTSLARSRLLHDHLPPEYVDMRARRAISLKFVPGHSSCSLTPRRCVGPPSLLGFLQRTGAVLMVVISRGRPWMPRDQIHRHPGPGRPPAPRSGGNMSGQRA